MSLRGNFIITLHVKTPGLLLVSGLLFLLCGCDFGYPVAGVVPPNADRATLIRFDSKTPRWLLHVDEQNRTIRCITSTGEPRHLGLVRTFNFDGVRVDEKELPIFRFGGWEESLTTWGGAVSSSCDGVAYLEHQYPKDRGACDLVYLCFGTGVRHILVKNLANEPQELAWLAWIDERRLTVAKHGGLKREQGRLMIIDVPDNQILLDMNPFWLSDFSLSHARRCLAYWGAEQKDSERKAVHILDLRTLQIVAATESGRRATFGGIEWNTEDDKIAYVMDGQLRTYSLSTKQSRSLCTFGSPNDYCSDVELQGYLSGKIYYRTDDQKDHVPRLKCLDEKTGISSGFKGHPEGPFHAYICRDGTIIYYKLSQEPLY